MTLAAARQFTFDRPTTVSRDWNARWIRLLFCGIVFFHWLGSIQPVRLALGLDEETYGIGFKTALGANIRIEDFLGIFLAMLVIIAMLMKPRQVRVIRSVVKPIAIFMCIGLFILAYSIVMKGYSNLFGDFRLFGLGFLGIGAAMAFKRPKDLRAFLWFILAIWFVEVLSQWLARFGDDVTALFGKDSYGNWLFSYLGFAVALGVLGSDSEGRKSKAVILVMMFLFLLSSILTAYRSVWLATIVAFVTWTILRAEKKRPISVGAMLVLGLTAGFAWIGEDISSYIWEKLIDVVEVRGSSEMRVVAWEILVTRWLESPIFGHGLGAGGAAIDLSFGDDLFIGTAHNAHLILLYHVGIFGVAAYASLSIYFVVKGIMARAAGKSLTSIGNAGIAGLTGFLFYSLATPLGPSFHYYFWIYLSLLASVIAIAARQANGRAVAAR